MTRRSPPPPLDPPGRPVVERSLVERWDALAAEAMGRFEAEGRLDGVLEALAMTVALEAVGELSRASPARRDALRKAGARALLQIGTLLGPSVAEQDEERAEAVRLVAPYARDGLHALAGNADVFAPRKSTAEAQLRVLFGLGDVGDAFSTGSLDSKTLLLPLRFLLEDIGFVFKEDGKEAENWLDQLLHKFGEQFPATKEFSLFARESAADVDPTADPDGALIEWMDHEEHLFRLLETHLVAKRLKQGFGSKGDDVEEFIKYSLSVQNRRKSRGGHAFEGHLEAIFQANKVLFERSRTKLQVTENNSKPDFIFPSFASYHDKSFPENHLFLLGAKTTCKDRWRQVLSEGERIKRKHLITLEAAISQSQTNEMEAHAVQLVVPKAISTTYNLEQQKWLKSSSAPRAGCR